MFMFSEPLSNRHRIASAVSEMGVSLRFFGCLIWDGFFWEDYQRMDVGQGFTTGSYCVLASLIPLLFVHLHTLAFFLFGVFNGYWTDWTSFGTVLLFP